MEDKKLDLIDSITYAMDVKRISIRKFSADLDMPERSVYSKLKGKTLRVDDYLGWLKRLGLEIKIKDQDGNDVPEFVKKRRIIRYYRNDDGTQTRYDTERGVKICSDMGYSTPGGAKIIDLYKNKQGGFFFAEYDACGTADISVCSDEMAEIFISDYATQEEKEAASRWIK